MEKVENTRKNGILKKFSILFLALSIVILIGVAYARYITRLNGSTQVPIAQWNFRVTAGSSQSLDIDLAGTRFSDDTQEVDRTKVAPGTAGALQLNINATGSQVSLEYNIDLTLKQIPENLIFYSDAGMTNALYKENGTIHLDGYFGASDTNKTATQNLYWQWKLETGSTQAEINANDLLDSEWIGERIVLGVQATGKQVNENPLANQYAVTFDLNGGSLENHGDSTQITKQVTYGENYGTLPEPTRDGYTFVGWSKNLADVINENNYTITNYLNRTTSEFKNDGEFGGLTNQSYIRINGNQGNDNIDTLWKIQGIKTFSVTPLKTYSLSFYVRSQNSKVRQFMGRYETGDNGKTFITWSNGTETYLTYSKSFDNDGQWHLITENFIVPQGVTTAQISIGNDSPNIYGADSYIDIANIQFAEDSSITPYYIQSSTQVVTKNNHTLIAKWEKDE